MVGLETLGAISGVVSQVKGIQDALKAALDARDAAVFAEKAVELNGKVYAAVELALAAQAAQAAQHKLIAELEGEIVKLKDWAAEKERYQLVSPAQGRFAFAVKDEAMRPGEPAHYACATCFEDGRKSILQLTLHAEGRAESLDCPRCGARFYTRGFAWPSHTAPRHAR